MSCLKAPVMIGQITQLTTSPALLDKLNAGPFAMTREQWLEQKISFVYSCVAGDGITKEQVLAFGEGFSVSGESTNENKAVAEKSAAFTPVPVPDLPNTTGSLSDGEVKP